MITCMGSVIIMSVEHTRWYVLSYDKKPKKRYAIFYTETSVAHYLSGKLLAPKNVFPKCGLEPMCTAINSAF